MAISLRALRTGISVAILAAGIAFASVGCQTDSNPAAPSSQPATSGAAGAEVRAGGGAAPGQGPQAQGPAPKVDMCHKTGNDSYHLINISANAESAHRNHGDGYPNGQVPGHNGYRFDSTCNPVAPSAPPSAPPSGPAPSPTLACSCWNTYTESQLLSLLNAAEEIATGALCLTNASGALLTPDNGVATFVYANKSANFCQLRLNGQDSGLLSLTPEQANQCVVEAVSFIPRINWCS